MSFAAWKFRQLNEGLSARPIELFQLVSAEPIWEGRSHLVHGAPVKPIRHQIGISSIPGVGKLTRGSRLCRLPSSRALGERLWTDQVVPNGLYLRVFTSCILQEAAGSWLPASLPYFLMGRRRPFRQESR